MKLFRTLLFLVVSSSLSAQCPVVAPVPNNACYNQVITNDAWCCNTAWDQLCQDDYNACIATSCPVIAPVPNDACYNQVITNDAWCCNNAWDQICQNQYDNCNNCPVLAPVPNDSCYYVVINDDPWCCNNSWDLLCQDEYDNCMNTTAPVSASDCDDAVSICTDATFAVSPNGFGNVDELCTGCISNPNTNPSSGNIGCLNSGELNSTWMVVNVQAGGTLEFTFGDNVGTNCYDWAMWPYDANTCDGIFNNTLPPVSCNWNGDCESFTGISNTPPGNALNFEPALNVNANEQYIVCLSNFSSATTNVPLNFNGTANIDCIALPVNLISFSGESKEKYNQINWVTGAEVNNDYFDVERSTDGYNFNKIGTVDGAGNSIEATEYKFLDYDQRIGTTYYRLRQYDFDGKFKLHEKIISISHNDNKPKLVKVVNTLGQEVSSDSKGIRIEIYSDGSTVKRMGK
ncbi:MAG: hypothetical protein WEA99_07465 [Brumimicrobium sp.]